jgi:hypothetical protein
MAQYAQSSFDNVCMTGPAIVGAFFLGLAITAAVFANTFWLH